MHGGPFEPAHDRYVGTSLLVAMVNLGSPRLHTVIARRIQWRLLIEAATVYLDVLVGGHSIQIHGVVVI